MDLYDSTQDRLAPFAIGIGLATLGAVLMSTKPSVLALPDAVALDETAGKSRWARAATRARDGVSFVAPQNAGVSIGRALVIAGVGMVVTRALDELIANIKSR